MKVAQVIVDIPTHGTDRPFYYSIPGQIAQWVQVGSRVSVRFAHRIVNGVVVAIPTLSVPPSFDVQPIQEVFDVVPTLLPDLVELSHWMSSRYACPTSLVLQLMIPSGLKCKAKRYVSLGNKAERYKQNDSVLFSNQDAGHVCDTQQAIINFVRSKGNVEWKQLMRMYPNDIAILERLFRQNVLTQKQVTTNSITKKIVQYINLAIDHHEAIRVLSERLLKGERQCELLQFLVDANSQLPLPLSSVLLQLNIGRATVKTLQNKGYVHLEEIQQWRDPYGGEYEKTTTPLSLTPEQADAYDQIKKKLDLRKYGTFLLHGVTGSGKTEVYLQTIQHCLSQGRQAIVLVPEISLTPQMVARFKERFGKEVAVAHSRLSGGERYDEWCNIREGRVSIVVGARSAIFSPFREIGLIIVDEEHETSYKQEDTPKYHTRDVAIKRAQQHGAIVILGSATPSLESYYNAYYSRVGQETYHLLEMKTRALGNPLPKVNIVDMREELRQGNRRMFSRALHDAILDRLERQEQIVLLLNRRGYATFVMCRSCGYAVVCPSCDVSLTFHQLSNLVRCHYCGYAEKCPDTCPQCKSEHIRHLGIGTQRVEEMLKQLFPFLRVIRMDVDTTSTKNAHEQLLRQFSDRKADVLLGTQMVAKGLDFPNVTLVGVILADSALQLPHFRASEKTFQLLTQVAGRAGRHHLQGEVFIQSYNPDHYAIVHASRHDYVAFVREELRYRRSLVYPPYCRLILITFSHEQTPILVRLAENYTFILKEKATRAGWLNRLTRTNEKAMEVLGPVCSTISRMKNKYRFQCIIKWQGNIDVLSIILEVRQQMESDIKAQKLHINIDVDPQMLT